MQTVDAQDRGKKSKRLTQQVKAQGYKLVKAQAYTAGRGLGYTAG
jgi:hypothetical protein